MRIIGHFLLWVGFLTGALCTVLRTELADNIWMTIPWLWYAPAVFVGVLGVIVLRSTAKTAESHSHKLESNLTILNNCITQLVKDVSALRAEQDKLIPEEIRDRIDEYCAPRFGEFADARSALVHEYGLQAYADVMTQFASAERFINRTWSAATDGYVDDVAESLKRAESHLLSAADLLKDLADKLQTV